MIVGICWAGGPLHRNDVNRSRSVSADQTTPPYNAECGIEAIVRKPA